MTGSFGCPVVFGDGRNRWLLLERGTEFKLLLAVDPRNEALERSLEAMKDTQPDVKVLRVAKSVDSVAIAADADLIELTG